MFHFDYFASHFQSISISNSYIHPPNVPFPTKTPIFSNKTLPITPTTFKKVFVTEWMIFFLNSHPITTAKWTLSWVERDSNYVYGIGAMALRSSSRIGFNENYLVPFVVGKTSRNSSSSNLISIASQKLTWQVVYSPPASLSDTLYGWKEGGWAGARNLA